MRNKFLILFFLLLFFVMFLGVIIEVPEYSNVANTNRFLEKRHFVSDSSDDSNFASVGFDEEVRLTGSENTLTSIVLNWRLFDSFGTITLIVLVLFCMIAILNREKKDSTTILEFSTVKPSVILSAIVKFCIPLLFLLGLYNMAGGIIKPGGGFQGGMIIGAITIVFSIMFGLPVYVKNFPVKIREFMEILAIIVFMIFGLLGIFGGVGFMSYPAAANIYMGGLQFRRFILLVLGLSLTVSVGVIIGSIFMMFEKAD